MNDTLKDLYNPNQIIGIIPKNFYPVTANKCLAFQEYPRSIEVWLQLPDGKLTKLRRWLKSSILYYTYPDGSTKLPRPFIFPKISK